MNTDEQITQLNARLPRREIRTSNRAMLAAVKQIRHIAYEAKQAGLIEEQRAALVQLFEREMK